MRTLVLVLVIVAATGVLVAVRAEPTPSVSPPAAVLGRTEAREITIQWAGTDQESAYPDKSIITIQNDWIRIEEPQQSNLRKDWVTFIPREQVKFVAVKR